MKNEIAQQNNRYIQNYQENYTVHEIAQKIIDNPKYREYLETAIPQIAKHEYYNEFRLYVYEKTRVFKGAKLGAFGHASYSYNGSCIWHEYDKNFEATKDGLFIPDLDKFSKKKSDIDSFIFILERTFKIEIEIGKIYPLEFPFYFRNKEEIEREIERIKKQQSESIKNMQKKEELEKQQKKDEEQRKAEKLLKDQQDSIEDISELLKELDKYVLAKQTIAIETLQEIENDLKILFSQKDNLEDIKSIQNYVSHFETTYIEAIKNQNLTDIIENRMLTVLQTFYEILEPDFDFSENMSESSDFRLKAIKSAGNKMKFEIEFNEKLSTLDEAVTKLQEKFANEKKLDFELLTTIENLSVYFHTHKDKTTQKKTLEQSKDILESIWKEYAGQDDKSSSSESNLKRILKNFYLFFGKSEQEIYDFFKKHDEEMEFSRKITEQTATTKQLTSSMRELESIVESHEQMKIEILQNLEDLLNELAKQKDIIQDKRELEKCKNHFDAVFKDFKRRKETSSSSKLRMQEIANRFDEILETKEKKGFFSKLFGK